MTVLENPKTNSSEKHDGKNFQEVFQNFRNNYFTELSRTSTMTPESNCTLSNNILTNPRGYIVKGNADKLFNSRKIRAHSLC